MRTTTAFAALLLSLLLPATLVAAADTDDSAKKDEKSQSAKDVAHERAEAEAEKSVVTSHSLQLGGRTIAYKATAGKLLIRDDKGKPDASVFYVAYTADGEKDPSRRPVTFLYNGGPGSASIWLHMTDLNTNIQGASGTWVYQLWATINGQQYSTIATIPNPRAVVRDPSIVNN